MKIKRVVLFFVFLFVVQNLFMHYAEIAFGSMPCIAMESNCLSVRNDERDSSEDIAERAGTIQKYKDFMKDKTVKISEISNGHRQETLIKEYLSSTGIDITLGPKDAEYLRGKVVLIAGAAGPIGRELFQTLAQYGVAKIIAIDRNETELHYLEEEARKLTLEAHTYVLDIVSDEAELNGLFSTYKPDIIFHLANYKSLKLGNTNASTYAKNNLVTTQNLLDQAASAEHQAQRFIFVSSAKAGEPDSPYSLTKRLCEMYVRDFTLNDQRLKTSIVRLANPVDTSGSFALKTFFSQIVDCEEITLRNKNGEYPARHFTRRKDNVAAIIISGAHAQEVVPHVLTFNLSSFKPLPINQLIYMMGKSLGIPDLDEWYRTFVKEVPMEPGEKTYEALPSGETMNGHKELIVINDVKLPLQLNNEQLDDLIEMANGIARNSFSDQTILIEFMKTLVGNSTEANSSFQTRQVPLAAA